MAEKRECPDRIFLQACDECYDEAFQNFEEVRWSTADQMHECSSDYAKDEEYVRLSRLKYAVKDLTDTNKRLQNTFENDPNIDSKLVSGIMTGRNDAIKELEILFPEL